MSTTSVGSRSERADRLVPELLVRDLQRSIELYTTLGFTLERRDAGFASLRWDDRRLFLAAQPDLATDTSPARVDIRIIVPDVDRVWSTVHALGLPVERPIADRYYGLRDFTVLDPDGY